MITREKGSQYIVFNCDACSEVFEAETDDFPKALDKLKAEKWGMQKDGNDWLHYCEACWTEDDDEEEDI
jgi:hypothetical protein